MSEPTTAKAPVLIDGEVWPDDAVEVGRVLDAWGIKGGFKVLPFSPDPQALFCTKRWFLKPAEFPGGVKRPAVPNLLGQPRFLQVRQAREQGDAIVVTAQGVDDRSTAESLKGARVFVSRSAFPTPDDDEFYWIDLIGLDVLNREGEALGRVAGLIETGPHCVLRCEAQAADGSAIERLIPFVSAYIDSVSLAERRIVADWGLDY
ncbi:ribosome maturation factor RimM [Aquabacterium sp. A3]|uniref:ribosome maturation factor RimM n=1 Tax=Aquabacterium sp. A3 TaxID=3132829 RepID=UPI0031195311